MAAGTRAQRMADLARDLRSEPDAAGTMHHLVQATVDLVPGCDASGITVAHRGGRIETPAASNDWPVLGDKLQAELGEGPCVDAAWKQEWVRSGDVAGDDRWPAWGPRIAAALGVRSMLCLQLFTHENKLGALNLYSRQVDAYTEENVDEAIAIAAHAAVAVAAAQHIDQLGIGMARRTLIGQAVGIMMERYDLDADRAFSVLLRLSSTENRKLFEIASELVGERRRPPN
jgi:GAF domain-containing protein